MSATAACSTKATPAIKMKQQDEEKPGWEKYRRVPHYIYYITDLYYKMGGDRFFDVLY
jgi:hypothetical protein